MDSWKGLHHSAVLEGFKTVQSKEGTYWDGPKKGGDALGGCGNLVSGGGWGVKKNKEKGSVEILQGKTVGIFPKAIHQKGK